MTPRYRRAFSLVELLVTLALIALLVGILLPSLAGARDAARSTRCLSNLRQLALAWAAYAHDARDRAMPLAAFDPADIGDGPQVFWWGTHGTATTPPDHARGFIAPYLDAALVANSVFECPAQPWGSYRPQGPGAKWITSTYGYNGYYLSPSRTPGWSFAIGHRPWRRLADLDRPGDLLVFADTLLPGSPPSNNALLDPPMLYESPGVWRVNPSPTTALRHAGRPGPDASNASAHADASARLARAPRDALTHPALGIGSLSSTNDPLYVPDWRSW